VFAMLARGDTFSTVVGNVEDKWGISISPSAISQMKARHSDVLDEMSKRMRDAAIDESEKIVRKTQRMISSRLNESDGNSEKLRELEQKWRDREITDQDEYDRQKHGLREVSINQLNQVSKTMFSQLEKNQLSAKELPPGKNSQKSFSTDPSQLKSIINAIDDGDTVELQRLVFKPSLSVTGSRPRRVDAVSTDASD